MRGASIRFRPAPSPSLRCPNPSPAWPSLLAPGSAPPSAPHHPQSPTANRPCGPAVPPPKPACSFSSSPLACSCSCATKPACLRLLPLLRQRPRPATRPKSTSRHLDGALPPQGCDLLAAQGRGVLAEGKHSRCVLLRKNKRPPAIAGVASLAAPSCPSPNLRNVSPAATTTTSPLRPVQ